MTKNIVNTFGTLVCVFSLSAQEVSPCGTLLENIQTATIEQLSAEYQRLHSYQNPFCDTTQSDYHKVMVALAQKHVAAKSKKEAVIASMSEPLFSGTLAEYENQKVTLGRDGKMSGTPLPPQYKIPPGDYYVVYLWRKKDYLVYAFKNGACVAQAWWEKGKY